MTLFEICHIIILDADNGNFAHSFRLAFSLSFCRSFCFHFSSNSCLLLVCLCLVAHFLFLRIIFFQCSFNSIKQSLVVDNLTQFIKQTCPIFEIKMPLFNNLARRAMILQDIIRNSAPADNLTINVLQIHNFFTSKNFFLVVSTLLPKGDYKNRPNVDITIIAQTYQYVNFM